MKYNGNFMAYGKLEELLAIPLNYLESTNVIFVTKELEAITRGAISNCTFRIVVQRLDEQNNVHIWRMTTGRAQLIYDNENEDSTKADERTESALEAIESYLSENGFEIHHASAGKPKDLILMDGTTEILRYNKEANRFTRIEIENSL